MNKKGLMSALFFAVIFFIIVAVIFHIVYGEIKEYNEYKDFCDLNTDICFCEYFECEYKTSWSSVNGLSEGTQKLCELAERLDNKKLIFQIGCER